MSGIKIQRDWLDPTVVWRRDSSRSGDTSRWSKCESRLELWDFFASWSENCTQHFRIAPESDRIANTRRKRSRWSGVGGLEKLPFHLHKVKLFLNSYISQKLPNKFTTDNLSLISTIRTQLKLNLLFFAIFSREILKRKIFFLSRDFFFFTNRSKFSLNFSLVDSIVKEQRSTKTIISTRPVVIASIPSCPEFSHELVREVQENFFSYILKWKYKWRSWSFKYNDIGGKKKNSEKNWQRGFEESLRKTIWKLSCRRLFILSGFSSRLVWVLRWFFRRINIL